MLLIKPYCAYLSHRDGMNWRQGDWDSRFYVKMIKDKRDKLKSTHFCRRPRIGSYGTITFNNTDEDVIAIRDHFGAWAARELKSAGMSSVTLFPVPNSHATPNMTGTYATREIAERIAAHFGTGAQVNDKLRFKKPMPSSSSGGGSRNPLELAAAMIMPSGSKPTGTPILIDDVMTSGAHMLASRTVLKGRGITAERGIVCGRTVDHQVPDPFDLDEEDLAHAFFGMSA